MKLTIKRAILITLIMLAAVGAPIGAQSVAEADGPPVIPCISC